MEPEAPAPSSSSTVSSFTDGRELTAAEQARVRERVIPRWAIAVAGGVVLAGALLLLLPLRPQPITHECMQAQSRCYDGCTWDALYERFSPDDRTKIPESVWDARRNACIERCRPVYEHVCSGEPTDVVPIAELLAHRDAYDGHIVAVHGFSEPLEEHCCMLFPTSADRDAYRVESGIKVQFKFALDTTGAIVVVLNDEVISAQAFPRGPVVVAGMFRAHTSSIQGELPGLTDVIRLDGRHE